MKSTHKLAIIIGMLALAGAIFFELQLMAVAIVLWVIGWLMICFAPLLVD